MDKIKDFEKRLKDMVGQYGYIEDFSASQAIEEEMFAYSKSLGEGLHPGRILKFSYADGYACYMVKEVKPRSVTLIHCPFCDAWHHPMIVNSKITRILAEQTIAREDALNRMFAKNGN